NSIPAGIDVGFSGGKDSIVTAELMRISGIKHTLTYSFTGLDAPEVVRFIRREYPHCKILVKGRTFWRDLAVNAPPSDRLRWCCTVLKKTKTDQVQGIRAEESSRRSNRQRINTYKGRTTYYPIFYWKEWQVWEFIKENGLKYPSLYDEGFDRIGCVVCPYHSEKTGLLHKKYRDRWPKYFERFEKGITELYWKRVSQGKKMAYPSPKEFLEAWYLDDSSRWYKKEDKQLKLF
ncbi:MAG: phosphoadenosine phosphosulfate reductase family protein, partial [Smithella sp.]